MAYTIVGLGNPGKEYDMTRHNTGRMALEVFQARHDFPEWKENPKIKSLVSSGTLKTKKISLILPETFMNKSGAALTTLITSEKKAAELIVVHDDLDLPLGKMKIVFNRSSGGHRGVESIAKALKTEGYIQVKIGISPQTPSGKLKKPKGDEAVGKFILGKFSDKENLVFKKVLKSAVDALAVIVTDGKDKAMGEFNGN